MARLTTQHCSDYLSNEYHYQISLRLFALIIKCIAFKLSTAFSGVILEIRLGVRKRGIVALYEAGQERPPMSAGMLARSVPKQVIGSNTRS